MSDGKAIVTGWSDGNVRAFTPQTGKLMYLIKEAHRVPKMNKGTPQKSPVNQFNSIKNGVICLSSSMDCNHILTGGKDGEVRFWDIGK